MDPVILDKDTIVAIATPDGSSALGVIRLSGESAWSIASKAIQDNPKPFKARLARFVSILDKDSSTIDQAVLLPWKSPFSYSGEDTVEFFCHGGRESLRLVLKRLIQLGARAAEPGEFTKRAFINGKITLEQAEAVSALIEAKTSSSVKASIRILEGKLSSKIQDLQKSLVNLLSLIEIGLDFIEEDMEVISETELLSTIQSSREAVFKLLKQYDSARFLRYGAKIVIAGSPNAGKSTLLNKLIGYDRAIVSDTPGTTRDYLDVSLDWNGIPVQLYDTAGLRDTDDFIESEGTSRASELIDNSDLIIWLSSPPDFTPPPSSLASSEKLVVVNNKSDLKTVSANRHCDLRISALLETGLSELQNFVTERLLKDFSLDDTVVLEERHAICLESAQEHLDQALSITKNQSGEEILALELHGAINSLGEITGTVTSEDILNNIFSGFCIGK